MNKIERKYMEKNILLLAKNNLHLQFL